MRLLHIFGATCAALAVLVCPVAPSAHDAADHEAAPPAAEERARAARLHRGATIWRERCAGCHGERGDGRGEALPAGTTPPDLGTPEALVRLSDGRLADAVRTHSGGAAEGLGPEDIEAVAAFVREAFLLPAPEGDVSLGQRIYARTCSVCHGEKGDGASWARNSLDPPPFNFRSAKAKQLTRREMINVVSFGEPGTAMMGFRTQLSREEIAAVVDYIRTAFVGVAPGETGDGASERVAARDDDGHARGPEGDHHREHAAHGHDGGADPHAPFPNGLVGNYIHGRELWRTNCVPCHGEKGDGRGPRSAFMQEKPEDFTSEKARHEFDRPHLFAAISRGVVGTEMPAWSKVLSPQQIADVAEFVLQEFILGSELRRRAETEADGDDPAKKP